MAVSGGVADPSLQPKVKRDHGIGRRQADRHAGSLRGTIAMVAEVTVTSSIEQRHGSRCGEVIRQRPVGRHDDSGFNRSAVRAPQSAWSRYGS